MTPEQAAATAALMARVQAVVDAARADLANSLAAQAMGDDGEQWLLACYRKLEGLTPKELTYACVLAMSGRAQLEARRLRHGIDRLNTTT